jgi:undecaprenyl-diphosphatase
MFFLAFIALFLIIWAVIYVTRPTSRHALRLVAHAITQNARASKLLSKHKERARTYWPVVATLVAGAMLTAWAGDGFLDLAELVHTKSSTLQVTDARWHDWAISERAPGATLFFVTMSNIGGPYGIAAIVVLATVALSIAHRYRWAIYLAVTAGGGGLLDFELKRFFARARPDVAEMLRTAQGYSFPSGHAMGSTVAFGALAYIASRALPQWRWKSAAIALAITLIVSVSSSRVYLGVHWISDIGAGIAAGTVWVTSTTVAYEVLRRIRRLRTAGLRPALPPPVL